MDEHSMGEGYERTRPWHPLYNLFVFPFFAWLYFSQLGKVSLGLAIAVGLVWLLITAAIDFFGWVAIKHPWSMTFREFYIDYQPWISIIYLVIFLSPMLAFYIGGFPK